MSYLIYIFVSLVILSLISLIGILSLFFKKRNLEAIILFLVSFSTGALFGAAFLHLLPESIGPDGLTSNIALYFLSGIITFFITEKFISWRHCHDENCKKHKHRLGTMNLIGDCVHNTIDGIIIAGAYLVSIPLGISATIGIFAHAVPQEISHFGILIYSKFSKKKALAFNFLAACFAFIGAIIALIIGNNIQGFSTFIISFAAGGFVYIAGSDLIPELHKETKIKKSLVQLLGIILGILFMILTRTFG